MPIRDNSPLKPKADGMEVKLRRRQSREAVPAYVVGISNGEWIVQGEDGTSGFSVPHNTGGLAIGQQVQKTRSNISMFDFGSASPTPTSTVTSVQTVSTTESLTECNQVAFQDTVGDDEFGFNMTITTSSGTSDVVFPSTVTVSPGGSITLDFIEGVGSGGIATFFLNWVSNYGPIDGSTSNPLSFTFPAGLDPNDVNVCPITIEPNYGGPI